MTDISAVNQSAPATQRPPAPPASISDGLGADTFLKLLVAQLKYQDPTSPAEGTEFLAQTAQFTMVEKLTALAEQAEADAVVSRNLGAAAMVGRTVTWLNDDGTTGQGVVASARLGSAGPVLSVGGAEVPFERVSSVVHTAPAPAATPAPKPTAAPAPTPTTAPPATDTTGAPADGSAA